MAVWQVEVADVVKGHHGMDDGCDGVDCDGGAAAGAAGAKLVPLN